jgi:hypothetical protein
VALIYRAIFDIEDGERRFVDRAPERALEWLRWKGQRAGLVSSSIELRSGSTQELGRGLELTCREAASDPRVLNGEEGALLADLVIDGARLAPIIVVSHNKREADFLAAAESRGWEIAKRLAGIAVVRVLGEGAMSSFSRAMHEAVGPDFDVYSGAIRVYLPGLGTSRASPGSHRFIPARRFEGRDPELAAIMIAPPLFRRATESPPPPLWLEHGRTLFSTTLTAEGLDELLTDADEEIKGLRGTVVDLERERDDARQDVLELTRQLDDLGRRNRYLRKQLHVSAPGAHTEAPPTEFEPEFCSEVVERVAEFFSRVEVHPSVMDGAVELDGHADESWARKAWLAFRALDAYAEAKETEEFDGDFKSFCERSAVDTVIPSYWVARNETKMTMANDRFRKLRVLPTSSEVDSSGRILMEQHIKIEQGGNPAPRIHFHDDTRGPTGKIHIGWFGPHLDSWAKS